MESLLEIQRRCHEERERLVKVMVDEFMEKKTNDKDRIFSDHRVKIFLDVSIILLISTYTWFILNLSSFSNTRKLQPSWLISMKTRMASEKQKSQRCLARTSSPSFTRGLRASKSSTRSTPTRSASRCRPSSRQCKRLTSNRTR